MSTPLYSYLKSRELVILDLLTSRIFSIYKKILQGCILMICCLFVFVTVAKLPGFII